jgi:lipoprotein-anchoring transpeptidase ErfK/SrfK
MAQSEGLTRRWCYEELMTNSVIHGAYWHDNFGVPQSHGCVNMNVNDAEWVYGNVRKGTYVHVHD